MTCESFQVSDGIQDEGKAFARQRLPTAGAIHLPPFNSGNELRETEA